MRASSSSLLLMMSFAAGTFSAGASDNPQHLMLAIPSGGVPNNPLPLIIWPRVVPEEEEIAAWFEKTFDENGWPPAWRYPIFPYTHFHPNTHEMLGVAEGWAEVLFGGDSGRMVTLRAGDAVLIPAGVGHRQVSASEDFMVIGAYPHGMSPETLRDEPAQLKMAQEQVKKVPLPTQDPFTGKEGALTEIWQPIASMHLQQQMDL
ncbi:cupin domain-containing protein [Pantoea sp. S62]|uniref:cupin domain-containing protein n=1 Tax=Pantoea sp. S62 TaxID=2769342 RepID=UPI0019135E5F|nr:cupin domain-containing protein [Pantoea sp. S62]MBK5016311.1 cupin domain-containing protein [Pantoea sp. S62]